MENQLECPHCKGYWITTSFSFLEVKTLQQFTYLLIKLAYFISIGSTLAFGWMALSGQSPDAWMIFTLSVVLFFVFFNIKGNAEKSRVRFTHKCGFCGHTWAVEMDTHTHRPSLAI